MQNMKIDIVYYQIGTDFEMEFNMGDCGRLRLLTDTTKDVKSFVSSLSRAVSRSKIIISCGPLFGEEGLITVIAKAVGCGTETVDLSEYGCGEAEILRGSTPLVSTTGVFGGCIIESGPQTMIVLTENREIRKNIMQNLIHPYIQEINILEITKNSNLNTNADAAGAAGVGTTVAGEVVAATAKSVAEAAESVVPDTTVQSDGEEVTQETQAAEEEIETEVCEETPETQEIVLEEQPEENLEELKGNSEGVNPEEVKEATTDEEASLQEPEETDNIITETENETVLEDKTEEAKVNVNETEFVFDDNYTVDSDFQSEEPQDFVDEDCEDPIVIGSDYYYGENNHKSINVSIIIIVALLAVIAIAVSYILLYLPYKEGLTTAEFVKQILGTNKLF